MHEGVGLERQTDRIPESNKQRLQNWRYFIVPAALCTFCRKRLKLFGFSKL